MDQTARGPAVAGINFAAGWFRSFIHYVDPDGTPPPTPKTTADPEERGDVMKQIALLLATASFAAVLSSGCEDSSTRPDPAVVEEEEGRIFIVDATGKKWDVTHAKEKYGMEPSGFQLGGGQHTIRPLIDPPMLQPGARNYPADEDEILIIGAKVGSDARAYPIYKLQFFEVANEVYGEAHVAVAY
jgi:hypothetical protein